MNSKPTGVVTFLFTDIEGSTKLAQKFPHTLHKILELHNSILKNVIESNNGYIFKRIGDAFCVSFKNAFEAVNSAYQSQIKFLEEDWGEFEIKVRMGLHTGEAEYTDGDYTGYITLTRTQRAMSAANGGQIIITQETYDSLKEKLDEKLMFRDLGKRRLKDLIRPEHLYQIVADKLPSDFPPIKSLDARQNNLPVQSTSFIGREKEIAAIKRSLKETNLLILLGTGGTGKTRLSIEIASNIIDDFPNGVWFVGLAHLSDSSFIAKEIASVFNLTIDSNQNIIDTIIDFLKDKELLIVLDNCEHLIEECANICEKLLSSCPKLKVLASSRETLRVYGEKVYQVPSLSLPDLKGILTVESLTQYEAVRLFIDRALAVKQDFVIKDSDATYLAELCHRLDGIPLAIELASARVRILTIEKILEKINDRFKLLTTGDRTALPRQQTLKALIDWSYDLLSEPEKLLFQRLSVFTGGWTIEAAEEVCTDAHLAQDEILDLLSNLVDKSLVISNEINRGNRYNMLESIRQYGIDKSINKTELQQKHFQYCLKLCHEKTKAEGLEQVQMHRKIKSEQENLRAAIKWAEVYDPRLALRLVNEIGSVWELNGNISEGLETYKKLLTRDIKYEEETKADALLCAGFLASQLGDYDTSNEYLNQSKKIYEKINNKQKLGDCINNIGNLHFIKDELKIAQSYHEESLSMGKETNDKLMIATSLVNLAAINNVYGNFEISYKQYYEGLELMRELNDRLSCARILMNLGNISFQTKDIQKSREYYEECLPILKEFDDHIPIAITILSLGNLSFKQKKYNEAELMYDESLAKAKEFGYTNIFIHTLLRLGDLSLVCGNISKSKDCFVEGIKMCNKESDKNKLALCFMGLSKCDFAENKFEESTKLFGISASLFERIEMPREPSAEEKDTIDALIKIIGKDKFKEKYEEGKTMELNEAIKYFINRQDDLE